MTKRQLILLYSITIFMMVWGFDLINVVKLNRSVSASEVITPVHISQALYAALAFVLTRIICRKFYLTRKYIHFTVAILGVAIAFILFRYLVEEVIYPVITDFRNYPKTTTLLYYALDNFYYAFVYITLGFLIFLLDQQARNQQKQASLVQQSRDAELQFLRSQINPHFLFNTLNNIYSLVYEQSPKAPSAVLQLSDLMRYMLYEKKQTVPLEKEWEYILNFITLQKMRFDYEIPVQLQLQGDMAGKMVPPYLLIPFIENAFKHGDFKDQQQPLIIRLLVSEKELLFETKNKISQANKDQAGGVGLENVKRRLELLYPGKYSLEATADDSIFSSSLRLKL